MKSLSSITRNVEQRPQDGILFAERALFALAVVGVVCAVYAAAVAILSIGGAS